MLKGSGLVILSPAVMVGLFKGPRLSKVISPSQYHIRGQPTATSGNAQRCTGLYKLTEADSMDLESLMLERCTVGKSWVGSGDPDMRSLPAAQSPLHSSPYSRFLIFVKWGAQV